MRKRCNVLCLLVLVAFAFMAEAPILQGTGYTPDNQITSIPEGSAKSYVVIGSITRNIFGSGEVGKPVCGVQRRDDYSNIVVPLSRKHGLDWRLVTAIMAAESSYNPCAVSPKGAMGLMQIMPAVAKEFSINPKEAFKPDQNVKVAVLLLKRLNKRYKGNVKLTLAAYNAGEGNVERYKGIPPFKETQNYVKKVMAYHADLKQAKVTPATGAPISLLRAR